MTSTVTFPEDLNLADYFLFDREREGKGGKVALRFGDRAWTYAEVAERARALARYLVDAGLRPEDRVYIVLPDIPPFAWGIFGTLAAGGVLAMGNPIAPADDLRYTLEYIKAQVLITTPAVANALAPSLVDLPHLKVVLLAPDAATGDDPEADVPVPAMPKRCDTLAHAMARGRTLSTALPMPS
ncbi:MAG TPA: AMP-binding protein [Kofleriaceae bacterium]|nr:AMP-binding protein [Kofleriaceae bacterium]